MIQNTNPNQRIISVHKEKCDKEHLYTTNNLNALNEAAYRLQSKGGFKLYMYIAKNQESVNKKRYMFALSSKDFCAWSGLSMTAYRTAFNELLQNGYLILKDDSSNLFEFYDKAQINDIDNVTIQYNNSFTF